MGRKVGGTAPATSALETVDRSQIAHRVQIASLVMAVGAVIVVVATAIGEGALRAELTQVERYGLDAITVALSLTMFLVARARWASRRVVDLALAYEVATSFTISFSQYFVPLRTTALGDVPYELAGLGWSALWIVVFAVIVPARPYKTLLAALLSAAAVPIVVLSAVGTDVPGGAFFGVFFFPYLLAAGVAYLSSRVLYRLGREVREARALGSYHLERLLGRGGMGEVWLARHKLLARPAAIKLIRTDVLGDLGDRLMTIQRFEREAEVTASLQSPHTVRLYDFGVSGDGRLYYAMELLDGTDLDTLVRRFGPVPEARAIDILRQVCRSLAEAHDRGLIHRDIKPSNIFIGRLALEYDFVKVLDFGLVKQQTVTDGASMSSRTNLIMGTPAFIAPEAVLGTGLDARSDLYSLGCVAFWLLTGRSVFDAGSPMEMLIAHVDDTPLAPSACSELAVSPRLDALVLRCLAKSPADRPATAAELARELEAIDVPSTWTQTRAAQWWEYHDARQRDRAARDWHA